MFVIVKNLHQDVTIDEFERLVFPASKQRFFEKKGTIKALKIVELVNRKGQAIERHGLIRVDSVGIKKRLIKSLNGRLFHDMKMSVGDYVIRHWSADRRAATPVRPRTTERRKSDRRRLNLRMLAISEKTFPGQFVPTSLARAF